MEKHRGLNFQVVLITSLAVAFTWETHEFVHWLTGTILGNQMLMTLNSSFPISGKYFQSWHELVVAGVGPFITIMEPFVAFFLLKRYKTEWSFPFLLTCAYMRTMAAVMNIFTPNDEGVLSLALGTDVFFISLLVSGTLGYLVYKIVKLRGIPVKQLVVNLMLIVIISSTLILLDRFHPVRLIG